MSDEEQVGGTVTKQESTTVFKSNPKWYERFQWPQLILTLIVAAMVGYALQVVLTKAVPESNSRIADLMLGYLMGIFSSVCMYWVGTTKASDDKTGLLAKSPPVDPH